MHSKSLVHAAPLLLGARHLPFRQRSPGAQSPPEHRWPARPARRRTGPRRSGGPGDTADSSRTLPPGRPPRRTGVAGRGPGTAGAGGPRPAACRWRARPPRCCNSRPFRRVASTGPRRWARHRHRASQKRTRARSGTTARKRAARRKAPDTPWGRAARRDRPIRSPGRRAPGPACRPRRRWRRGGGRCCSGLPRGRRCRLRRGRCPGARRSSSLAVPREARRGLAEPGSAWVRCPLRLIHRTDALLRPARSGGEWLRATLRLHAAATATGPEGHQEDGDCPAGGGRQRGEAPPRPRHLGPSSARATFLSGTATARSARASGAPTGSKKALRASACLTRASPATWSPAARRMAPAW